MINLTQGDTGYGTELTIEDENGPVNLTDTTVLFFMETKEPIYPDIVDAPNGKVLVGFTETETFNHGVFKAQIKVEYPDGAEIHYPSKGHLYVRIQERVK